MPRILRNLLARLDILCDNAEFGCQEIVKLESLQSHHKDCKFNPKRPIECSKGCGFVIPKDEIQVRNGNNKFFSLKFCNSCFLFGIKLES